MRSYEPFYLTAAELPKHYYWIWGGVHVFTATRRELTVDVLVEWFAELAE